MFDVRCTAGRHALHGTQYAKHAEIRLCGTEHSTHSQQKSLADQLAAWRDSFKIGDARRALQSEHRDRQWTCAVLFSGGCLDTLAAIRTGFTPLWGCETNQAQGRMWEHLTGTTCLGDVFGAAAATAARVKYIKAGAPCPDYARSGTQRGADGETGWMFVKQAEVIEQQRPWAFCLEISDYAEEVHDGREMKKVHTQLSRHYVVKQRKLAVWRYGDPSNRKRIFMVGVLRELGQAAYEFQFPRSDFDESNVPTARTIAVPDAEVKPRYWRQDAVEEYHAWSNQPGRLHKIASTGEGMGPSRLPHAIYAWDGLLNGQTTLNGGGRRPELGWQSGQPISRTRLTVPVETLRAASLPSDYQEWSCGYADGEHNSTFLRRCVNNGVPLRTGTAIDAAVLQVLQRAKHRAEHPVSKWASLAHVTKPMRSILFDTGANGSLCKRDIEQWLSNPSPSSVNITVANQESLVGCVDGRVHCNVLNTARHSGMAQSTSFSFNTTTTDGLAMELLSFDEFYRDGWGVHCRPISLGGVCEMYKVDSNKQTSARVPLRYDWAGAGGFCLDYCVIRDKQPPHTDWLARYAQDQYQANSAATVGRVRYFDTDQYRAMLDRCQQSSDVFSIIQGKAENDRVLRGVKAGLRSDKQKLTERELHELFGHIGYMPGCKICKLAGGAARRIRSKVDPHREERPGHTWHVDTVTMSHRSDEGCKYLTILRCAATGKFKLIPHYLKSDICELVREWISVLREDPAFHSCPYKVISQLRIDNAGEWGKDCQKWQQMVEEAGVECIYSCPDRKESHAAAERNCGIIEVVIKSILMQSNLPQSWWQLAAAQAEFLLDRLPMASQAPSLGPLGDRARPLELFTRGAYERRQIDRELSYFMLLGTPALVHTTAKGSALQPKTRWGIAVGMYREQVIFRCPYSKSTFRSKSFAAFRLREGLNFAQFLGLPALKSTQCSAAIPSDFNQVVTVELPAMAEQAEAGVADAVVAEVRAAGELATAVPVVTVEPGQLELGGSVHVIDSAGNQLLPDSEFHLAHKQSDGAAGHSTSRAIGEPVVARESQALEHGSGQLSYVDVSPSAELQAQLDAWDAKQCQTKGVVSVEFDNFTKMCKLHKLPFEQHGRYKHWLVEQGIIAAADLPAEQRGARLQPGLNFPYPSGSAWLEAVRNGSRKRRRALQVDTDWDESAVEYAECWLQGQLRSQHKTVRSGGAYSFNIRVANAQIRAAAGRKVKTRRTKAVSTSKVQAPANTWEALTGDDVPDWVRSMGNEFYGLCEMGVFGLGYTRQHLLEIGIDLSVKPAVPIGEYFECKFDVNGELNKRKTRMAIQGHARDMKKGVHFNETFAATPRESTTRLLQALVVLLNLSRLSFDITKAYCWADLPPEERIALKYPSAFKEYDHVTGEELYLVQLKNLYGSPSAGRNFGKQRDAVIQEKFNGDGWSCDRCRMDPCLFRISKQYTEAGVQVTKRAWLLAHVDDCDMVGEGEQILADAFAVCQSIWKCEQVSSDFMLGVRRRLTHADDGTVASAEIDMIPFVEGMSEVFKQHLPDSNTMTEPVPEKFTVSKLDVVPETEVQQVLNDGFQAGMGMALWAARHCFPECRLGCSLLCRVMAKPSRAAFQALMQMIAWIYKHRSRGIKFTADVNPTPVYLVDASNKPDPADGKCQFGYVCMWMGGPLLEHSKKLRHIGLSSQHNKHMPMHFANRSIVWLRQLLEEMGLHELLQEPTVLWADNKPANILSKEDIVGSGNQYIYLPYHFNKETQELGFSRTEYIKSQDNLADLMTKAVSSKTLQDLLRSLTGHDHRLIKRLIESLK